MWKAHTIRGGKNSALAYALFNDADPKYERYRELPVDRLMVEATKQGLTNNEVAALVGRAPITVRNTLRQPWARKLLIESMREAGQTNLKELLKSAAEKSLKVIEQIRDDPKVKPETRLAAAINTVDRFLGRPAQTLEHNISQGKPATQMSDDELAAIASEALPEPPSMGDSVHISN